MHNYCLNSGRQMFNSNRCINYRHNECQVRLSLYLFMSLPNQNDSYNVSAIVFMSS